MTANELTTTIREKALAYVSETGETMVSLPSSIVDFVYEYAINERTTEFDNGMVKMAFSFFKAQIKRDFEKYYEKCEKLRQNALKRYEKDNDTANACNCSQEEKEEEKE